MRRSSGTTFLAATLIVLTALLLLPTFSTQRALAAERGPAGGSLEPPECIPGEVVVVWKEGATARQKRQARAQADIDNAEPAEKQPGKGRTEVVKLPLGQSTDRAIEVLKDNPNVEAAGPNLIYQPDYTPTSPDFAKQWPLDNTGQTYKDETGYPGCDIDATGAWDIETGNSNPTTIAIIDSGIDLNHPNLSGKLWTNNADPIDGADNDSNGYVDDYYGYNWSGISSMGVNEYWGFGYDTSTQSFAQKFKAQGVNELCPMRGLEIAFNGKVGDPTATITYSVRSSLSGPDIAVTNPIDPSRIVGTMQWNSVYEPFISPVNLTPGNDYYFVVSTSSVDVDNYYYIIDYDGTVENAHDPYVEGNEYRREGGVWTSYPSHELYFKGSGYYYVRDNNGHGTHCAGIAAGADLGSGPVGVSFGNNTRIMALKAGSSNGNLATADIVGALEYASDMGADVVSMSFSSSIPDAAFEAMCNEAHDNGVTMCASAGNTNQNPGFVYYPCGYTNVIGVGATQRRDEIAVFSTWNQAVDMSAPGVEYYSTMPGYAVTLNGYGYAQSADYMNGTSMACPCVAGVAALLKSHNPALSPDQIETALETTADDLGDAGRDDYFGYGRVNALRALGGEPVPVINSITKPHGRAGQSVTIAGSKFGNSRLAASDVYFGATAATTYASWKCNEIVCEVPGGLAPGDLSVTVSTDANADGTPEVSNGSTFCAVPDGSYVLDLEIVGSGSVSKTPDLPYYADGTPVQVEADAGSTWTFDQWGGALSGSTNPETVTMDADKDVTSTFVTPLGTALDCETLTWTCGGDANWAGDAAFWHYGGSSARSPKMTDFHQSWIETTVEGPGRISFWWKVSCETRGEWLKYQVDDWTYEEITGYQDWVQVTDEIEPGTHVLKWLYPKDGQVSARFDSGWVDNVSWTPTPYQLSLGYTGEPHGTITKVPDRTYFALGEQVQVTAHPDPGYLLYKWYVNYLPVTSANPYTHTMQGHTSITAEWREDSSQSWTVTAAAPGGHGFVSPGSQVVNQGATASVNIAPDAGYHTASIVDNGASKPIASPYVIQNVSANHQVVVTFAPDPVPPEPETNPTWYLAEGTTAWGFETYVSVVNPNSSAVTVDLTYMPSGEANKTQTIEMAPNSRATVYPKDLLGEKDFSTRVNCRQGLSIAADRTMEWKGQGVTTPECHSSIGVTSPAKTWYLPEGSTNWGFETWLLLQNPNATKADCVVTYMIEGKGPKEVRHEVPPNSRASFNMATDIGQADASIKVTSDQPVILERAMYRNGRREGHDSIGTTAAATDYYLAEGTSAWGFTTYVLVQNPNGAPADVTVTYMTPQGPRAQPAFSMPANSRKTIRVNDILPGADFSTRVTGSRPIIAERSMYWGEGAAEACHDSIGMSSPHMTFYLPDGQAGSDVETWTLVQNPNSSAVMVKVTYLGESGQVKTVTESIAANSRKSFNMADAGVSGRNAIQVSSETAGKKIMVERAMYRYARGAGTDTIGGYSD